MTRTVLKFYSLFSLSVSFTFVFQRHSPYIFWYHFDVMTAFRHAETGEMTISVARVRARPEAMSPFDFLTTIRCRSAVGFFRLSLTVQKLFDYFN
jgi:hypothetical protein